MSRNIAVHLPNTSGDRPFTNAVKRELEDAQNRLGAIEETIGITPRRAKLLWNSPTITGTLTAAAANFSAMLDVASLIRVTGTAVPASGAGLELSYGAIANTSRLLSFDRTGAAFKDIIYSALSHRFLVSNSEKVRIDSTGNVGIGTTSPQATLDVQGSFRTNATAKSANYTLTTSDNTILVTNGAGAWTLTLPAASANTIGLRYTLVKVDSGAGTLTLAAAGSDTINGAASINATTSQYVAKTIVGISATAWAAF